MGLDRTARLKLIAGLFGIFVSVGAALFTMDGRMLDGLIEQIRLPLTVLGAVGLAATGAFAAKLPGSRALLVLALLVGTLAVVAYLGGLLVVMLQSPEESFRKGKAATLLVGAVISAGTLAFLGALVRGVVRDG